MVPGVFCRIAPPVMTFGDPGSQNCFRFVQVLRVRFAQKYATDLRRCFSAGGMLTGVGDCGEIGSRSIKVRCHGNNFFVIFGHFPLFCYAHTPFVQFVVKF